MYCECAERERERWRAALRDDRDECARRDEVEEDAVKLLARLCCDVIRESEEGEAEPGESLISEAASRKPGGMCRPVSVLI